MGKRRREVGSERREAQPKERGRVRSVGGDVRHEEMGVVGTPSLERAGAVEGLEEVDGQGGREVERNGTLHLRAVGGGRGNGGDGTGQPFHVVLRFEKDLKSRRGRAKKDGGDSALEAANHGVAKRRRVNGRVRQRRRDG